MLNNELDERISEFLISLGGIVHFPSSFAMFDETGGLVINHRQYPCHAPIRDMFFRDVNSSEHYLLTNFIRRDPKRDRSISDFFYKESVNEIFTMFSDDLEHVRPVEYLGDPFAYGLFKVKTGPANKHPVMFVCQQSRQYNECPRFAETYHHIRNNYEASPREAYLIAAVSQYIVGEGVVVDLSKFGNHFSLDRSSKVNSFINGVFHRSGWTKDMFNIGEGLSIADLTRSVKGKSGIIGRFSKGGGQFSGGEQPYGSKMDVKACLEIMRENYVE